MAKDLLCVSFKQHSETVDEHNICDKDCALSMRENLYFIFVLHSVFYVKRLTCVQDNMVMQLEAKTTPISPKLLYQLRPWDLENVIIKEKSPVYITLKHRRQVLQVLFDAIFSTDYRLQEVHERLIFSYIFVCYCYWKQTST